jgi:hypothetical protein
MNHSGNESDATNPAHSHSGQDKTTLTRDDGFSQWL